MNWAESILWLQAGSTWFMVGVIWFVQLVHYPLFREVHRAAFPRYEQLHQRLTSRVVMPPMLVELLSAVTLPALNAPNLWRPLLWANLLTVLLIWALTFFVQVPQHARLAAGFHEATHRRLVIGNWSRTVLWSLRGGLVFGLIQLR